ncbi:WD40 repeat-like protein [Leucogyrophana mollusca]|uniref:WD40 repeat-like protein n=1 Tax=Leucogyrophana mollusca TaxID=85980 RepID=A0ACB8B408_9AGAM|nr:WD40 repeat-like protein [Leucogyrophana mollusca]
MLTAWREGIRRGAYLEAAVSGTSPFSLNVASNTFTNPLLVLLPHCSMSMSPNSIESPGMRRASRHPTKIFKGHTGRVSCVVYFPDGRRLASASIDKTIIVWDVENGRQDGQPLQHDASVKYIAISLDGRRIASGMEGGGLVVWDVSTREVFQKLKGCGIDRLAYSPDGRWIAAAPMDIETVVRLWDVDTGGPSREPLRCESSGICVAFSPDGSRIAAGLWDGSFEVFDIATGKVVVGPIKAHTQFVSSLVYSPDGRLLVTASWDESIRVWDAKTGVQVGKPILGHRDQVNCLSVTADGRRIASGGFHGAIRVWDLDTRQQVGDPFNADGRVFSVAFSPEGRYIISCGEDNAVYLWDTESLAIQGSVSIFNLPQHCFQLSTSVLPAFR